MNDTIDKFSYIPENNLCIPNNYLRSKIGHKFSVLKWLKIVNSTGINPRPNLQYVKHKDQL